MFENGDVDKDKDGFLKINFVQTNILAEIHRFMWSFHPKKMHSLAEIEVNSNFSSLHNVLSVDEEHSNSINRRKGEMHFMGIFKGLKHEAKFIKNVNMFSIVGTLCDPIHER